MAPDAVFTNACDFSLMWPFIMGKYEKHIHSNRSMERSRRDVDLIFTAIERGDTDASF